MKYVQIEREPAVTRRGLFGLLPAGIAGCLGCARAACAQAAASPAMGQWKEKADLTWEQIFRFSYQKDLIPLLTALGEQTGREKFVGMLRDASDSVVRKKTAGRPPVLKDLAAFSAAVSNPPPLMQHAVEAEITANTADAFEYRVTKCLWAKSFRDENAGDIGYAMICYPDYAVARGLNPKLKLIRSKTLMQGDDCCVLRYVMET